MKKVVIEEIKQDNKLIIFDKDENTVILRKFDSCKPSTIVMLSLFDGEMLSRDALYALLPCAHESKQHDKINGTLASVRYEYRYKGIPGKTGRCFPNAVTVEVWNNSDKMHTKVSRETIQICGVKSFEFANVLSETVINFVNQCQEYLEDVHDNAELWLSAINWLIDNSIGESKSVYIEERIDALSGGKFWYGEQRDENEIKYPDIDDIPDIYLDHIIAFQERSTDLKYHYEMTNRAYTILSTAKLVTEYLQQNRLVTSMIKYDYNLGFVLNRYELQNKLNELGYKAEFSNITNSPVTIAFSNITPVDPSSIARKKEDSKSYQSFVFHHKGSISHCGCDLETMRSCYTRLMRDIARIKDSIRIEPLKSKFKPTTKSNSDDCIIYQSDEEIL